mgnify:CR=1 FL=1
MIFQQIKICEISGRIRSGPLDKFGEWVYNVKVRLVDLLLFNCVYNNLKERRKMDNGKNRYELRIIEDSDYRSYANSSFWHFTNDTGFSTTPAGHSDKRKFPSGTTVLCRLKNDKDDKGIEGYFLEGFAKITKFSRNGRPVEFGDSLSNILQGHWTPPASDEIIYDERIKGEVKEIR